MSTLYSKTPSNYTYLVGLANAIDYEIVPVTLTGVIVDTLTQDLILPPKTFVQDGQIVNVSAILSTTSLVGSAPTLLKLNGTTIFSTALSSAAGSAAFMINTQLIRIGSTLLNVLSTVYSGYSVVNPPSANGVFSGSFIKLTGIDFNSQFTLAYSSAVPNGGQNVTQELCYCSIV